MASKAWSKVNGRVVRVRFALHKTYAPSGDNRFAELKGNAVKALEELNHYTAEQSHDEFLKWEDIMGRLKK